MQTASVVHELAKRKNVSSAQIALSWLLHKGNDIVPIPGTKHRQFLEDNIAAVDIHLTESEMQVLDNTLPPDGIAGARYGEQQMKYIDR